MKKILPLALAGICIAMPALANDKPEQMKYSPGYMFDKMDSNKDGKVSKAEHDAFAAKKFSDMDTNNDNILTKDEMAAYRKSHMDEMAPAAGGDPKSDPSATGNVDVQKKALEDKM
jgi:hypothetical protein